MRIEIVRLILSLAILFPQFLCVSIKFSYTGEQQILTVPKDINKITVDICGAAGGVLPSDTPGYGFGTRVQTTVEVTGGSTLYVFVGGQPISKVVPGTYSPGGSAGYTATTGGTGGGGASDIRTVTSDLSSRIVVAGGGEGNG